MLNMLDMNNLNNQQNSPDINLNYRDVREIRPPQTANNFFRPNRMNPEANSNNNNSQNFQANEQVPSNFPRINKQNFNLKKSQLNISSENIDNDIANYDDQYQDETQPRVYFKS